MTNNTTTESQSPETNNAKPEPTPDWRDNPVAFFVRQFCANPAAGQAANPKGLVTALSSILKGYERDGGGYTISATSPVEADREEFRRVVLLLRAVRDHIGSATHSQSLFLVHGPVAVPTTPTGLAFLRFLIMETQDFSRLSPTELTADGTQGRAFVDAVATAVGGSGVFLGPATNQTEPRKEDRGRIVFGLPLSKFHTENMPTTIGGGDTRLPTWGASSLVGTEFPGNRILEFQEESGACGGGTAEVLERFGISHEFESIECDSCGAESGESEHVSWCADFTIDAEFVEAVDKAGYLDELTEFLGVTTEADWGETLNENDDDELRERFAVPDEDVRDGLVEFDTAQWRFEPDYESVAEELETAEVVRLLPLLVEAVKVWTDAKLLPPIPGTLRPVKVPTAGDHGWSWDGEEELTHVIASSAAGLVYYPASGSFYVTYPDPSSGNPNGGRCSDIVTRHFSGPAATFTVTLGASQCGMVANDYIRIAKARTDI